MPYRSQEELEDDMEKNPKLARMRVAKAKQAGLPVVSKKNPGYGNSKNYKAAAQRRLASYKQASQTSEEDEFTKKRKQVGY